jgi:hypothetical protein
MVNVPMITTSYWSVWTGLVEVKERRNRAWANRRLACDDSIIIMVVCGFLLNYVCLAKVHLPAGEFKPVPCGIDFCEPEEFKTIHSLSHIQALLLLKSYYNHNRKRRITLAAQNNQIFFQ